MFTLFHLLLFIFIYYCLLYATKYIIETFFTILQIFSLEVTLIRDQGWINVGAYGPKSYLKEILLFQTNLLYNLGYIIPFYTKISKFRVEAGRLTF